MEQTAIKKRTLKDFIEHRYGITSWWQFALILIVFSVTGSASVYVGKPVLKLFGIQKETMNPFIFWPLRILVIFPIYQVLLITIGALFGQFEFFWKMEKQMMQRMTKPFTRKKTL